MLSYGTSYVIFVGSRAQDDEPSIIMDCGNFLNRRLTF